MATLDTFDVVGRSKFWGGPDITLSQWVATAWKAGKVVLPWPQLDDRTVIATFRGRTAIALGCKILGLGPGDEILVPAYNCGTEIDALVASGLTVVAYRVGADVSIDLDDLRSRLTARTRAVYVIHYFGWEQPMLVLRRWCDEHRLKLIEDCALALFSDGLSRGVGRTGDAAIFSLPKSLGTWHGGLLSLAVAPKGQVPQLRDAGISVLVQELKRTVRSEVNRILTDIGGRYVQRARFRRLGNELSVMEDAGVLLGMPQHYYFNPSVERNRAAHPRLLAVVAALPWKEIIRERQANYLHLAGRLEGTVGIKLLLPVLPSSVCPLLLPLLVRDRDKCTRRLLRAGIVSYPWWSGFHHGVIDWSQFPDACRLKQSVLTVPVHQGLGQLDDLADMVKHALGASAN